MLHRQRWGRCSRQSVCMTRSCVSPCSPALWLNLPWSGTNRDTGGEGPSGTGLVPPLTARRFQVGLVDYVATSLKRALTLHRKGRQGGQSGELLSSPPSTIQAGLGVTGHSATLPQTDLNLTSLARRLRTSVTECLEWRNEVSSQSSAPVTSRSSQIPLALDLHLSDKPGPGPLLQVRFCVVLLQKRGVLKAYWSCCGSLSLLLLLCFPDWLCLLACLYFSFLKTRIDKCAFALKRSWKMLF